MKYSLSKYLLSFRPLLIIYFAATVVAAVEIIFVRHGFRRQFEPIVNKPEVMADMATTYMDLYPDRGASHHLRGALAFKENDHQQAREHFERALARKDISQNVLYGYSVNLVLQGEDSEKLSEAIDKWRWHYPKSERPDPRTAAPAPLLPLPSGDSKEYVAAVKALRASRFEEARFYFEQDLAAGSMSEQLLYNP